LVLLRKLRPHERRIQDPPRARHIRILSRDLIHLKLLTIRLAIEVIEPLNTKNAGVLSTEIMSVKGDEGPFLVVPLLVQAEVIHWRCVCDVPHRVVVIASGDRARSVRLSEETEDFGGDGIYSISRYNVGWKSLTGAHPGAITYGRFW